MNLFNQAGTSPTISGAIARLEQRLPTAGDVLTRVGQRVEADDLIGRARVSGAPLVLHVARVLDLPVAQALKALRRAVGETINQGEELARGPLPGQRLLAPINGTVVAIDSTSGYVVLRANPEPYELRAAIRGVVMEMFPGEGVRIETPAAQIYGAWGIGGARSGVLSLLTTAPDEPITAAMIDSKSTYGVVIGGSGISAAALRRAVTERITGVIVGSIDEAELRAFLEAPGPALWDGGAHHWQIGGGLPEPGLTIVVTEGFGTIPMSQPVFDLLAQYDRRDALLLGQTTLRNRHERARVIIPLSARNAGALPVDPPQLELQIGAIVRVVVAPYLGQVGRVRALTALNAPLPNGLRTSTADVQLEHGMVSVPQTALEVLR
jgi:hypothetical protein